jgi:hypothetical protein
VATPPMTSTSVRPAQGGGHEAGLWLRESDIGAAVDDKCAPSARS